MKKIKVRLLKSLSGTRRDHRATAYGLGLKNMSTPAEIAARRGKTVEEITG